MELFLKITTSILEGFGLYSLFYIVVGSPSWGFGSKNAQNFDDSACELVAKVGTLFLISWLFLLSRKHLFGPYWLATWIPFLLVSSSQLLWLERLRKKTWIRVLISLCLLISVEDVIIWLTSLHREYLPSTWSLTISDVLLDWLLAIGVFILVSIVFHRFTKGASTTKKKEKY